MTKITFNKSNRIGDDVTYDVEEFARQFWASADAHEWLAKGGYRLERVASGWAMENLGGWTAEEWPPAFDAVHAAMPREDTTK
jgi:hypothetical protein